MLESILNKIAERSQALKDKDAAIDVWQVTATEQEARINELTEGKQELRKRNKELQASTDRAYATEREANRRAEAAESQLREIAEALGIPTAAVEQTPEQVAATEVAEQEAAPSAEPEAPATEG